MLVHGDLHLGNTLWIGNTFAGYVDWDGAGVGRRGVDLGWSRFEAALQYSPSAADEIVRGWAEETGPSQTSWPTGMP